MPFLGLPLRAVFGHWTLASLEEQQYTNPPFSLSGAGLLSKIKNCGDNVAICESGD